MRKRVKRRVLFIAGLNCDDPSGEVEFNKWYNNHIKKVIEHNGFLSGSRYEIINPQEGYPKYLAIYEVEDETAYRIFMEEHKKRLAGQAPRITFRPPSTVVWEIGCKPI